jgi:hypothetical protein
MIAVWRQEKGILQELIWRLVLMKQAHLTVTKTLTPVEGMTKTLLLQMVAKFIFGQDHRTLGILVVSILSLD